MHWPFGGGYQVTHLMFVQDVLLSRVQLMAVLLQMWMLMVFVFMLKVHSAIWVTCQTLEVVVSMLSKLVAVLHGENSGNLYPYNIETHLSISSLKGFSSYVRLAMLHVTCYMVVKPGHLVLLTFNAFVTMTVLWLDVCAVLNKLITHQQTQDFKVLVSWKFLVAYVCADSGGNILNNFFAYFVV